MKCSRFAGCFLLIHCAIGAAYAQISPDIHPVSQTAKSLTDTLVAPLKNSLQQLTGGVKLFEGAKPIAINQLDAEAEYSYFHDTSGMGPGVFRNIQGMVGYNINYGVSIASMPFALSIRENNGINTLNYTPFQNFYHFNFDHDQYVESIRSKVMEKVNPENLMNIAMNRVNSIRHNYEQELQGDISQLQKEYAKVPGGSPISLPKDVSSLSANDLGALQNRLLPGTALEKYQQDKIMLQQLSLNKDPKTLAADSNYNQVLGSVRKYETLEKIYTKVTEWNSRFNGNPLVRELAAHPGASADRVKSFLTDPANLGKVIDDQASISTIQRVFYNVKQLNIGQNSVQSGDLAMKNVVNNGVNAEFQNKNTTIGAIHGSNSNVNSWQQAGLTSQVTNEYSSLSGFKIGTGTGSPIDQSISFNFFNFNNAPNTSNTTSFTSGGPGPSVSNAGASSGYLPMAPHKDGVISLHTGYTFGDNHSIVLDVSKSFGSYQHNATGDSASNKSIPGGSVFNNAGKANYAATIGYTGTIYSVDCKLFVRKVGLGYSNPGNSLLRSGETEFNWGFSRKILSKFTLKYNGDFKDQVFDPSGNYTYRSFSNKLQSAWKINRYSKLSLTWERQDYHTSFYGQSPTNGVNQRLQLDGAYRLIVGRQKITNNLTISQQTMNLPMIGSVPYSSRNLLITHTSSLMLKQNLLSVTILSNHSDNKDYYFNTSLLSMEANYSYTLSGNMRFSSGAGYYVNYGWNRQLGIRQQLSAAVSRKFTVDLQAGCRKAIQTTRSELANQLYVTSMVHYIFK